LPCYIDGNRRYARAKPPQFDGRGFQPLDRARRYDDIGSGARKCFGQRSAKPTRTASDKYYFSRPVAIRSGALASFRRTRYFCSSDRRGRHDGRAG